MALISPRIVAIPKPATLSFGEAMNQHRTWLDERKIQPALFRQKPYEAGVFGFEITFHSEDEAYLFDKQFG